jgi:hypothetical protein
LPKFADQSTNFKYVEIQVSGSVLKGCKYEVASINQPVVAIVTMLPSVTSPASPVEENNYWSSATQTIQVPWAPPIQMPASTRSCYHSVLGCSFTIGNTSQAVQAISENPFAH